MTRVRCDDGWLRSIVLAIALAETGLWLFLLANAMIADEPAVRGLDHAAAILGTAVFAVSGAPALVLAARGQRLRLAASLATLPAMVALVLAAVLAVAG